ncbi:MAG: DNA replication/repair protein RecF [Sphingomonadaceae bacterium]
MFLHHLSLTNFRNYPQLELDLPAPVVLFQGDNGQGKSNLLEAVYFLATTRPLRAGSDRELINWRATEEPLPFARVAGEVRRGGSELKVEIVIRADRAERAGTALAEGGTIPGGLSKRIKVNGVVKRALDLIGLITVVTFSPQDLGLIAGAPALRRRFLDISNCQVDPRYCRALQQYNRVVVQRNHLLKQIRENRQPAETLDFWSDELVKSGSYLLARRNHTVEELNNRIDSYHRRLTGTGKRLRVVYRSSVEEAGDKTGLRTQGSGLSAGEAPQPSAPSPQPSEEVERQAELFREAIRRYRKREVAHGMSLVGPHRDDLLFLADGIDMNVYGSRGEQRAVALALKLSEVEIMQAASGERPILLLDDVMSELDPARRRLLLETIDASGQTLITATDMEPFSPEFLARAALFHIEQGAVTRMD